MKKPFKALIVEDSPFMARLLSDMLQNRSAEVQVLGIADSGQGALQRIEKENPDVIFLDIELQDMTGFELLKQVQNLSFKTIFTTAHSHYAIKAFRFNALDYLIKPIREEELDEALSRLHTPNKSEIKEALDNLEVEKAVQKLVLTTQKGTLRFTLKQITHIEGESNYSSIHLYNGKKELSSRNLAYFEDLLKDKGFYRCHRSFLVNAYHIEAIKNNSFQLKNYMEIPISRRKKAEATEWFFND